MKYNISIRILHWTMSLLVIFLFVSGYISPKMDANNHWRWILRDLHESIGLLIFPLVIIRIFLRSIYRAPKKAYYPHPQLWVFSRFVHFSMYFLLITIPISGYLFAMPYGVKIFQYYLPVLDPPNFYLAGIAGLNHTILANIFLTLCIIHICAVILDIIKYNVSIALKKIL